MFMITKILNWLLEPNVRRVVCLITKILNWLLKPNVPRVVSLVSCVVGLLCYGLSSSFNYLFGEWIWWKILLYIVCSFLIILLIVRSGMAPDITISLRTKVNNAFLVQLFTTVYSYFVDEKVNGKPDAYSLVSSATFAITSLGLSTFNYFGFEVDLLSFFSSLLISQLMKIQLWLVIVGGGFMYSLDYLRSYALQQAQVNSPQVDDVPPENEYLGVLVVPGVGSHSPEDNSDSDILMARFMRCLEVLKKENNNVMSNIMNTISKHVIDGKVNVDNKKRIPLKQWHLDENLVVDSLPPGIINDFCESAQLMETTLLVEKCLEEYIKYRREFLLLFPSPNLKMEDIDNVEKIEHWLETSAAVVRILFANERRLCLRVFGSHLPQKLAFTDVCTELATHLLFTFYVLATWSPHVDNYMATLMKELMLVSELMFLGEHSYSLRKEFSVVGKILDFSESLERNIHRDVAQDTIPSGIHPDTCKVMDYFRDVFVNRSSILGRCLEEYTIAAKEGKISPSLRFGRVIKLLDRSLEATSKNFKTSSMGYVFLMNNRRFMEQETQLHGLELIIGYDWLKRNQEEIVANLQFYLRCSWSKILNFLKPDIYESVNFLKTDINESEPIDVVARLMIDKLRWFNEYLNDICNDQFMWFVFDGKLREQIIKSIKNILLPAYGKFIGRFEDLLGKDAYEHIKLGMFAIEDGLNTLFLEGANESDAASEGKKNA